MIAPYVPNSPEEETWLENYHAHEIKSYPKPSVTTDIVLFTVEGGTLKVLLIERGDHPYKGFLALPGGYLDVGNGTTAQGESIRSCAYRELLEETGLSNSMVPCLEEVGVFGEPYRDPRGRVITIAHMALVSPDCIGVTRAGDDAVKAGWFPVFYIPRSLAFDHDFILDTALDTLRNKGERNLQSLFPLLPQEFSAVELGRVFTAVFDHTLSRQTFYSKVKALVSARAIEVVRTVGREKIYKVCR